MLRVHDASMLRTSMLRGIGKESWHLTLTSSGFASLFDIRNESIRAAPCAYDTALLGTAVARVPDEYALDGYGCRAFVTRDD